MYKFTIKDILSAINYAQKTQSVAGIVGHPDTRVTRMYNNVKPFLGVSVSLWEVPTEFYSKSMTVKERRALARQVYQELNAKYNT